MKFEAKVFVMMMTLPMLSTATDIRFQPFILSGASTLGELVEIIPEQPAWSDLRLDSHPHAGDFLEKNSLLDWIAKHTGEKNLRWLGIHKTRIHSHIHSKSNDLAALAKNSLLNALSGTDINEVVLQRVNSVPDSEKEMSDFKAEVFLKTPIPRRICVWLKAENEKHPVWFKIKAWSTVWVAKRRIRSHVLINADDFMRQSREIAGLKGLPVTHFPEKQWLKRDLESNAVLMNNHIEAIAQIQKGQAVDVLIKDPNLTIHMQALAEQDGHTGEMIKLKNTNSNKSFYARVTATQQAEIHS